MIAYDPYIEELAMTRCGVEPISSLEELLKRSDIVSMHAPSNDEVFHCYKDKEGVKVFLEDYVYLSQLMINLYETTGKISYLNDAIKTMNKTWDLFYDLH